MSTVAIVGAGHVAGATAHALAVSDRVGRLLLIDEAASAAQGKALDIRQAAAIVPFHTRLDGTDDLSRVTGCSVCVIADRFGSGGEWMGDEGLAMIRRLTLPWQGAARVCWRIAGWPDRICGDRSRNRSTASDWLVT